MYLIVTDSRGRLYIGFSSLLLAATITVATIAYILAFIAAPSVDIHTLPLKLQLKLRYARTECLSLCSEHNNALQSIPMYLIVTDSRGRLYIGSSSLLLAETIWRRNYCLHSSLYYSSLPLTSHILPLSCSLN